MINFHISVLNPHGSDETVKASIQHPNVSLFLTHTVQMKLKSMGGLRLPELEVLNPHGSDETPTNRTGYWWYLFVLNPHGSDETKPILIIVLPTIPCS